MAELFKAAQGDIEKARTAFFFVRDEIAYSFDWAATIITTEASDVLKHGTGIFDAKPNLYAALLLPSRHSGFGRPNGVLFPGKAVLLPCFTPYEVEGGV